MKRSDEKLEVMLDFARGLAKLSTCRRDRVGCVIIPKDVSCVYAIGYNGPPRGQPNDACSGEIGQCGCTHAEANAVAKLDSSRIRGTTLISTRSPCAACAGLIANCKAVDEVLFISPYREWERGALILLDARIGVARYDSPGQWRAISASSWRATRLTRRA